MGQLMLHQLTCEEEAFATEPTLEWLGVTVDALVSSKMATISKPHPASWHITHKRFDPCVGPFMCVARASLRKGLITEATAIGFLPCMAAEVPYQGGLLAESAATDLT